MVVLGRCGVFKIYKAKMKILKGTRDGGGRIANKRAKPKLEELEKREMIDRPVVNDFWTGRKSYSNKRRKDSEGRIQIKFLEAREYKNMVNMK